MAYFLNKLPLSKFCGCSAISDVSELNHATNLFIRNICEKKHELRVPKRKWCSLSKLQERKISVKQTSSDKANNGPFEPSKIYLNNDLCEFTQRITIPCLMCRDQAM